MKVPLIPASPLFLWLFIPPGTQVEGLWLRPAFEIVSFPFPLNFHGVFCWWTLLMKALAFGCAQNTDAWQVSALPQLCSSSHVQQESKRWAQSSLCGSSRGESPRASHCAWCPRGRTRSWLLILLQRTLLQCSKCVSSSQLPASQNLQCRTLLLGKMRSFGSDVCGDEWERGTVSSSRGKEWHPILGVAVWPVTGPVGQSGILVF